jgi:copper chaperone CopZ
MTELVFNVSGLHCQGCVNSVQSILRAQRGVRSASVDLAAAQARIVADTEFDPAAAARAMAQAGFALKAA